MRRLTILLLFLFGALAVVGWRTMPVAPAGQTRAVSTVVGASSVSGSYAFSDSIHDPITGQEGAAVGTIVFDGLGGITGVYSQNSRCSASCGGQQQVTRAPYAGTYVVHPDGSATLDFCIQLTTPFQPTRVIWEGSFFASFVHLRFIQTNIASPCSSALSQSPNVTVGAADRR